MGETGDLRSPAEIPKKQDNKRSILETWRFNMGQTVLEMIGIKKSFSGIYALSGIDFSLSWERHMRCSVRMVQESPH